ncbi:MAG: glycosyltransferase family 4 protein [Isosphaeraceae bacterium]|nr:glycosyltransferase family 4 protein [Isosphaeraceae bacterium]
MRLALNFQRVDPSRGGAETYVADLCRRLVAAGHRVDLYANQWVEGVLPPEVNCIRIEATGWTRAERIWSFGRNSEAALRRASCDCSIGFINTWHQDVLIPQGGVRGASLEANSRRFPAGWRRWLYLTGKRANPKAWLYRAIERRQYTLERPMRVVAVSRMVQGHLERFLGVPRERIRVIPNAIDTDRLAVDDPATVRRAFRRQHGLAEDDLVALFVGHNFRLKGLHPLLEALAFRSRRTHDARPIHLIVCGGGRLGPIRRQVERLGLGKTIHLIGFLPDIRAGYWASDCFVLPTYYDPCSLVVFEALACGLPVITTACNGAGELITLGREGFVIDAPDDHDQLADALDRIADDAARRVMSIHAEQLGRAQSFDNHVARLIELFEEVAAEKSSPQRARREFSRI